MVTSFDAGRVSASVAEAFGSAPACTVAQARAELERHSRPRRAPPADQPGVEVAQALRLEAEARLAATRRLLTATVRRVPAAAAGVPADRLRALASATRAAAESAHASRLALGDRPRFDLEAARAAIEADGQVVAAVQGGSRRRIRASLALTVANIVAIALLVAMRWVGATDLLMLLVGTLPLGALALAAAGRVTTTRQARDARLRRAAALRSAGVTTMAGLAARRARLDAWTARAAEVADLERAAVEARRAWESVAGRGVEPAEVDRVVDAVESTRRARAELEAVEAAAAHAATVQRESRSAPPPRPTCRVVTDTTAGLEPVERTNILDALAAAGTVLPVVLVTDQAATRAWAAERSQVADDRGRAGERVPASDAGEAVQRVAAGRRRLRARTAALRKAR